LGRVAVLRVTQSTAAFRGHAFGGIEGMRHQRDVKRSEEPLFIYKRSINRSLGMFELRLDTGIAISELDWVYNCKRVVTRPNFGIVYFLFT
jgi:hypothetical protein